MSEIRLEIDGEEFAGFGRYFGEKPFVDSFGSSKAPEPGVLMGEDGFNFPCQEGDAFLLVIRFFMMVFTRTNRSGFTDALALGESCLLYTSDAADE